MAFDIYAGGFARYYAREWENVMQAHSRENGIEYQMVRPKGDSGPADWDEVAEAVGHWRGAMVRGLQEHAPADLDWSEDRSAPYFTDRPGWDGYSALVLLAACTACGEPLPERLPEDALASEIVLRTHDPELRNSFRAITMAQLWLPGSFDFSFDFPGLTDETTCITSVKVLVEDLDQLVVQNGIRPERIQELVRDGYPDDADFITLATYGLGIFSKVAKQALAHRLPIQLSY